MSIKENHRRPDDDEGALQVRDVDSYHQDVGDLNQYMQVGLLVERWADVVEEFGEKAEDFWIAFVEDCDRRDVPRLEEDWKLLSSTGIPGTVRQREMFFVSRKPVIVAVLIARQGMDLYLSWRCFIQNPVSEVLLVLIALVAIVLGLPGAFMEPYLTDAGSVLSEPKYDLFYHVLGSGFAFVLLIGLIMVRSALTLDWDVWGLLREPIHELQYDEVASLSTIVHKSLMYAADKVGIDTTKLEPREPAYLVKRERRRRI